MGCCCSSSNKDEATTSLLDSIYKQYGIVPGIIPSEPGGTVEVTFEDIIIEPGKDMTPAETKMNPLISFNGENDKYYTLLCVDPDAPSRKVHLFRNWLHQMIVNIPGSLIDKGDVLAKYSGPEPPKGSGNHRYIFLVYEQLNGKQDPKSMKKYPDKGSSLSRSKFKINKFVQKYQCDKLIAANFFICSHGDKKGKQNQNKNDDDNESEQDTLEKYQQKNTGSLM